ncbi:hypothetical protein [Nostoc sp.]|uniref:hypothetical protein n=1 Tax=Nostoc sp. TaxID=1180 RepID=UPI002FF598E3
MVQTTPASTARRKSKGASALGRQRRGEAVAQRGFPPRGTAESVSRLEATVVGSADLFAQRLPLGEATGVQKSKVKSIME